MIDLNKYRENIYQNSGLRECPHYGEDGVILKIFSEIGVGEQPYVIEFGESRSLGTTTRSFRLKYKAGAFYFSERLSLKTRLLNILDVFKVVGNTGQLGYLKFLNDLPFEAFCTPENIVDLLSRAQTRKIDILTIDIDSYDYFVAERFLTEGLHPSLLILEYNWNLPLQPPLSYPYPCEVKKAARNKRVFGANYTAMASLAERFEYRLVHISGFCNLFFVKKWHAEKFLAPNADSEIPTSDEDCVRFADLCCQKGFRPSWFGERPIKPEDIADFIEI